MKLMTLLSLACALSLQGQDKPGKFEVGGLKFAKPAAWKTVEAKGDVRKAQFEIPSAKGADAAECVFFHFGPGGAGGVQANVGRWLQQFAKEPAVKHAQEQLVVNGVKLTFVLAEGTYLTGPPFGEKVPKANSALLGGIIEAKDGSLYIRLTGPAATVRDANKDFRAMLESALK